METASVGKLLLLAEVARQCDEGSMDRTELLDRNGAVQVADSGIWQHLQAQQFSVRDLCVLVASVSDNLAANVLLDRVGLDSVQELCEAIGFVKTALLDRVRDHRGPDDVWTLSVGSAAELSDFTCRLADKRLVSLSVSKQLNAWLATGVDLSMVASAFGLDPLAHTEPDRGFSIHNKTGTDVGVRADVGTVERGGTFFSYAVIANWDAAGPDLRDAVLAGMRSISGVLRASTTGILNAVGAVVAAILGLGGAISSLERPQSKRCWSVPSNDVGKLPSECVHANPTSGATTAIDNAIKATLRCPLASVVTPSTSPIAQMVAKAIPTTLRSPLCAFSAGQSDLSGWVTIEGMTTPNLAE